jgi:hypothetical protein
MSLHSFHIPVMGLGFTIDTPLKVAHYGIDSVISIVDDDLIEKMRKVYSEKHQIDFMPIDGKDKDYRAKRVTGYLNLVGELVKMNFEKLKENILERGTELGKYYEILPDNLELKQILNSFINSLISRKEVETYIDNFMSPGSIDVNIMTKVDKKNFYKNEELPVEYNDAHSALRGFAESNLSSSVVLSAGMNPRLYSYFENFEDFYPDVNGNLKKKIVLKVSDYRSAFIQGKYFAKKGLWVSEYRIESGLNCGGHAFATDGYLMGPILEEFKTNRSVLLNTTHEIFIEALKKKNKYFSDTPLKLKITAQGGVGTFEEHNFLLSHYQLDSIGWGTPFLLVPEVTNVDEETLALLCNAQEEDLFLSNISPLGVPFNTVTGASKDIERISLAVKGRPGSPCPKKYLISNTEFSEKSVCTASIKYQRNKIDQLESQSVDEPERQVQYDKIIEKSCLCVGLSATALKINNALTKADGAGVLICPGPNMAYFSSVVSLKEMISHIYGRINLVTSTNRPHMFMKELKLYLDYIKEKISEINSTATKNQTRFFDTFQNNISEGIQYYKDLFSNTQRKIIDLKSKADWEITKLEEVFTEINNSLLKLNLLSVVPETANKTVSSEG